MLFVNIRVRKITPLFGLKLQNFGPFNAGPFYAGPFNAAPQKLTPIRAGVKRANKVVKVEMRQMRHNIIEIVKVEMCQTRNSIIEVVKLEMRQTHHNIKESSRAAPRRRSTQTATVRHQGYHRDLSGMVP